jgi:hypothetical protein
MFNREWPCLGKSKLRYEFEPTGKPDIAKGKGAPGRAQLYINNKLVGKTDLPLVGLDGGLCVARYPGSAVSQLYKPPFAFTRTCFKVTADVCVDFWRPVPTPHLDELAARGLRYTRFHTTAICGPSRAHSLRVATITTLARDFSRNGPRAYQLQQHDAAEYSHDRVDLEVQRLRRLAVRQEPQHARLGEQRRRCLLTVGRRDWSAVEPAKSPEEGHTS